MAFSCSFFFSLFTLRVHYNTIENRPRFKTHDTVRLICPSRLGARERLSAIFWARKTPRRVRPRPPTRPPPCLPGQRVTSARALITGLGRCKTYWCPRAQRRRKIATSRSVASRGERLAGRTTHLALSRRTNTRIRLIQGCPW